MDYRILPSWIMDILGLWTMITMPVNAWSISLYRRQKQLWGVLTGAFAFVLSFFLFEIEILSYHLSGFGREASPLLARIIPSKELFVFALACVSLISLAMLCHHFYNWQSAVTERSISFCVDSMPVGICYYRKNGRILLTNACMKRICYMLTGKALLNAVDFIGNVKSDYVTLGDDSIWKVKQNTIAYEDEEIYELICTEVSELVEKSRNLRERNREVLALNEKLKQYQFNIDELIRRKEILKAKMDIHDEMNTLMLMTVVALDSDDDVMLSEAVNAWEQNALLATSVSSTAGLKNVEELSKLLGITIEGMEYARKVPREYVELYCTITREALTFSYENTGLYSEWTGNVSLTGGLNNIKRLVSEQGGDVTARVSDGTFILQVIISSP